jgi:hypothetical protein
VILEMTAPAWRELPQQSCNGSRPEAVQAAADRAHAQIRLQGILGRLRAARRGERSRLLFWASLRTGELVTDGDLDARTAIEALASAATQIGLASEDGPSAVAATIRSGFHRAGAA